MTKAVTTGAEIQCADCGVSFPKPPPPGQPPTRCDACRRSRAPSVAGSKDLDANKLKRLARAHTDRAVKRLAELIDSEDENVALKAINSLLDRAYGKAPQSIQGEDGGAVKIMLMSFREHQAQQRHEEDG